MTVKILIADQHDIYRDGMRLLIRTMYPRWDVFFVRNYACLREKLDNVDISLLIIDLALEGSLGIKSLERIRSSYPALTIIVYSASNFSGCTQRQLIRSGATGFINKLANKNDIIDRIQSIVSRSPIDVEHEKKNIRLSPRQLDTLKLLTKGRTNKEIAKLMGISSNTAREYVSQIIRIFNVENRTHAVLKAIQHCYLFEEEGEW